uniref:F-box domain-containing protein n=1 Tax=Cyclopterus lumpus TaxID=8103 RepID=A0A8C3AIV0_CYCLU
MAAGRGEFLPSFLEGLRRNRNPNSNSPAASVLPCLLVLSLPSEILLKVLSYLDVSSLSCISHVSRTFHRLADDNVLWQKIYISDFGSRTWRPKSVASDADQEDRAAGYWKKMYFRTVAGQDVNNWKRERRDVSPLTGLPLRTRYRVVLLPRNLNVSWELMLCGEPGQKITMQPSRVDFFESSAVLHFSGAHFPRYHRIRSILLHGVRKEAPGWRSLILKLEVKNRPSWFFGKDNLVRLRHFLPGVTIGTWRNCCIMTLTLLDDFQKPFWSVSSSVFVVPATRPLSPDYVGEHFLLHFRDPEGQLRMELVRLTEQRQFLVIGLVVNLPVLKVNKRFGRAY